MTCLANVPYSFLRAVQLDFFPSGDRKEEAFEAHFNEHGLEKIVRYHKSKQQGRLKNDLRAALKEVYDRGDSTTEVCGCSCTFLKFLSMSVVCLFWRAGIGTWVYARCNEGGYCANSCCRDVLIRSSYS